MATTKSGLIVPEDAIKKGKELWSVKDCRKLEAIAQVFVAKNLEFTLRCVECHSPTKMSFSAKQRAFKLACICKMRTIPVGSVK